MVTWLVLLATLLLSAMAEWLHARRVRRMAYLAFGPRRAPRSWARLAGPVRVVALGALAWGLMTLLALDSGVWQIAASQTASPEQRRHLVVAIDVSPSMDLKDAGSDREQTRGIRAREVLRSIIERVDLRHTGVTVIAFFNQAKPVFIDTLDPNVVHNVLDDLPLEHAFSPGKTDLFSAVAAAAEVGNAWPPGSATLVLVSDGDTLPHEKRPTLPAAFGDVLVLGTGDPHRGKYIDGHNSRQDGRSLERLALQLGGTYYDANTSHVPTQGLGGLTAAPLLADESRLGTREAALVAVAAGAACLALLGPLLAALGGAWNSARARPSEAYRLTTQSMSNSV